MWIELIAFFLGVSLILYCVLAGADFGAGILELFLDQNRKEQQRAVIEKAIAPVWEANHVWIILALVIVFNGFPKAFHQISISFHLPLTLMLIGIILRGCAFTFRHYDAVKDQSQRYYGWVFSISSIITPFALGLVTGGVTLGKLNPGATNYPALFIQPWFNFFSVSLGLFLCALFTYLAAVYLTGETKDTKLRAVFLKRAKQCGFFSVLLGMIVFIAAEIEGLQLFSLFFSNSQGPLIMTLATALFFPIWRSLKRDQITASRIFAASQVSMILLGWFIIQFPILVRMTGTVGPTALTLYNSAAPEATLRYLGYALIWGSALIFPALYYLFWIFKKESGN